MARSNKKRAPKKRKLISNVPVKQRKPDIQEGFIVFKEGISVNELATKLDVMASDVIKILFMEGKMVTINSSLADDEVELVCMSYNLEVIKQAEEDAVNFENFEIVDDPKDLIERPPVITIMGHVDHGKTTLLDRIRKSKVVEGEFGGITQHIGAYQVEVNGKKLTFLDTPGHEAFTAMRARGAQATDIVIIVVAADDGVMPQTKEAIDHAKNAGVPIIVAVNKIDKEHADLDRILGEMSDAGLMPEEWGGDTIFQKISAKMGTGINELLETILTVAELSDLKANPNRYAYGTVIEAKLDKGRGPVATLLVQNGTLREGDPIVVGSAYGRVRQMQDDIGKVVTKAGLSTPVEITGLNEVPIAGDKFMAFELEKMANQIGEQRQKMKKDKDRRSSSALTLDALFDKAKDGETVDLNVIIKADTNGTAEAVKASLEKIDIAGVRINVLRSAVGAISEGDVIFASASNGIIYGFNVRPTLAVRKKAEEENIDIRLHNVIYKMVEELETAMKGMLKPEFEEKVTGQAEIRQLYKVSKIGTIAGCFVIDGSIKRDCGVRLIRDGIVVYEGKLASLRRFQNDAKEVMAGYECGMSIENYNDLKENDIIEGFVMEEKERD